MKKFALLILMVLMPIFFYAQKLEVNGIDPVSRLLIKHTSWERFTKGGQFNSYFRVSQVDSVYFFEIRIILIDMIPFSIKEGQRLILTLSDGSTETLTCFKNVATTVGGGAIAIAGSTSQGLEASYKLSKSQLSKLRSNVALTPEEETKHKKNKVEHLKIDTNLGLAEHDLSENSFYQIRKAIRLVQK